MPEEGKLYRDKTNGITYARVTSVDKNSELVFYDIGMEQIVQNERKVVTLNSSSDLIWDFFEKYEYCRNENIIWE